MSIKAYKGFDKDLKCRDFQYEIGKEYETDDAMVCNTGFHACEAPLDVFKYYQPSASRYCEVEQDGKISRADDDTKVASSKIKIGAEVGIPGLVKAQIEWVRKRAERVKGAATSGYRSSAATSGYRSSAATSGNGSSAATSGNWSSAATSGNWSSAATSGYRSSAATSGNGSSAATSGEESSAAVSHKNAVAVACGKNAKAKGTIGSYIVLTEWNDDANELLTAKLYRVDGENVKADTWYILRNGEIEEVEDGE